MMAAAVEQLKNNPDMRQAFINKVAPTITTSATLVSIRPLPKLLQY